MADRRRSLQINLKPIQNYHFNMISTRGKACFKCHKIKSISCFYRHPMMADGHLNKCKICARNDSAKRFEEKMRDPEWAERERARNRFKQKKYRVLGLECKPCPAEKLRIQRRYRKKYPDRDRARDLVQRAIQSGVLIRSPCRVCGSLDSEAHHEDYSKPLKVMWFCPKHHGERHVHLRIIRAKKTAKI